MNRIYKVINYNDEENHFYIFTQDDEVADIMEEFSKGFISRGQLMEMLRGKEYEIVWPEDFEEIEG
jgi:hypothetical protein